MGKMVAADIETFRSIPPILNFWEISYHYAKFTCTLICAYVIVQHVGIFCTDVILLRFTYSKKLSAKIY